MTALAVVSIVLLGKGYHSPTELTQGQPCKLTSHRWPLYFGDLITLNLQILHLSQARCINFGTFLIYFLHIVLSFLVKGSFIDFFFVVFHLLLSFGISMVTITLTTYIGLPLFFME